jgi:uncharacterized protein (DUF58 family)
VDVLQYLQPQVVSKLANMELRARLVVEGFITGLHRSPYHGFSVEFAEHRQYMPGDEIKHLDWKIYGRTDRYYVKRYEEETNLKAYLLLDTSASMGYSSPGQISKLQYASYIAASLAYMMMDQRDAVGLALFDDGVRQYFPPHATRPYLRQLLLGLEAARPAGTTGAGKALHQLAERIKRRGLVIVLSDLFDDPEEVVSSLKHFRHRKNEVIVMQILDPLERSFAFGDEAFFEDLETRDRLLTQPRQIQRVYREALASFVARYRKVCREHAIDYALMDTSTTFDVALLGYLGKRARLH